LEKENDVADGTSKANSAIVHAGYDPEPHTKMARYNVEGNALAAQICADLDIMYKRTGSLVVGFDDEDRKTIGNLYIKGNRNNVPGLQIIEGEELFKLEPALSRDVVCALYAPTAGIIAPWEFAFAQAECAVKGGAKVEFNAGVTGIKKENGIFTVSTKKGDYTTRFVVNASGVDSDVINEMINENFFTIQPKRGEYYILDTTESGLVNTVVFPCPSKLGKGVLVAPTVHGNVIVGPNSEDCSKDSFENTASGLKYVTENALRCVPSVNLRASIRNFSGLRADANLEDFIVGESESVPGFFNIAGIKSPGLTASSAIAKDVAGMLLDKGLDSAPNPAFVAKRRVTRFKHLSDEEKQAAITRNPLYGTIVCRCETVTEGEIVDALNRPLPPRSLDAVKRRCTTGMGRCQGGFCGPRVMALIAKYEGMNETDIPMDKQGMYIVTGRTKVKETAL
jgi:glycerol-3-phosphate dehydrogenase